MSILPEVRRKLSPASQRNKSLQEILPTLLMTNKILSVETNTGGIHNTKITVELKKDPSLPDTVLPQQRVLLFNRLDLASVLQGLTYTGSDINTIIVQLNLQGCDFTTDDIELVDGELKAKASSLAYRTVDTSDSSCHCVLDSIFVGSDYRYIVDTTWYPDGRPNITQLITSYRLEVTVDGIVYMETLPYNNSPGFISNGVLDIITNNNLSGKVDVKFIDTVTGRTDVAHIRNLLNTCSSFGLKFFALGTQERDNSSGSVVTNTVAPFEIFYDNILLTEMCPMGQRKIVCTAIQNNAYFGSGLGNSITVPVGEFELVLNETSVAHPIPSIINSITLATVIQIIIDAQAIYGCVSIYSPGSGDPGFILSNTSLDCLKLQLYFTKTSTGVKTKLIDVIIGTTPGQFNTSVVNSGTSL